MNTTAITGLVLALVGAVAATSGYVYHDQHRIECGLGNLIGKSSDACSIATVGTLGGAALFLVGLGVLIAGLARGTAKP